MDHCRMLIEGFSGSIFVETAFFNCQTITEKMIENKALGGKKRFPQFLLGMYVFLCLCVCLSVIDLQTSSLNIEV